ncbi:c-type cytochrome [Sulfurimonas autotrophica]|uniref:Cytochrome c class I n=1 Tax=Sulfurimonas autotrophica (strain ATCC BAA-671 / DSM 16294 / JCM 11897 / OK10) TaxID=563040 RepID=E0UQW4_SULAO|nr:cytochrome c [Sulfurimonas autotrophica]ADN08845.1 cytochrome c class I [Sulfurimonas autotrophica DSM 16294]
MKLFFTLLIITNALYANIENGKDVYIQNCANCHSVNMRGGMGPDFNIVSYSHKKADIAKYISSPSTMFRSFGYTSNAMPELPLSPQEIKDVSEYIDSLQPFKKWMKK